MTEVDQVTALCERLGAPRAQAKVMALQLIKRADQIAAERSIPRAEAMRGLLEVVMKGRAGEVPARFAGEGTTGDSSTRAS